MIWCLGVCIWEKIRTGSRGSLIKWVKNSTGFLLWRACAVSFVGDCGNCRIILNYSRNSIWIDNSTMNLKIDPCSHNITQLTRQKGIKSLWLSSEQLLSCQCSLIVAIPAVHSACRYLKVSHRIHSYRGNCCTVWMWYILLNELLLQQSSAILNGRYQCVAFAYLLITPIF